MNNTVCCQMTRRAIAILLIFSLTACNALFGRHGYFRDRGDDYVKATEIPPMKVPDTLDSSSISELFVIPPISNEYVDVEAEFVVPRPDFTSSAEQSKIKIQKLDLRRWISINESPSEVWPRVQSFLEKNKIEISLSDPTHGEIETAWLILKDEPSNKDRYKIKIQQGIRANSCEIHVLQVTVTNAVPQNSHINWPYVSLNPEREKWMLDKLATYLTEDDKSSVSLLAQSVGGTRKVDFVQPYQADPFLVFALDMDRTWASVGGGLSQHPFAIVDLNRSEGIYHISYDPTPVDKEKPGFFCRITWCDKRAIAERIKNLQYYQIKITESDGDDTNNNTKNATNNEIKVVIKNSNGETLSIKDAEKLLSILRNQLV